MTQTYSYQIIYTIVRHDRNRHGEGVAFYVRNSVLCKTIACGPENLELIIASLCKANFKLCLGVFCRPPSSHCDVFDNLCEALLTIDQSHFSNFVLLGDFNVNYLCESSFFYLLIFVISSIAFHLHRWLTHQLISLLTVIVHLLTQFLCQKCISFPTALLLHS